MIKNKNTTTIYTAIKNIEFHYYNEDGSSQKLNYFNQNQKNGSSIEYYSNGAKKSDSQF